ncbi:MAG: hypothetical protein QHH07_02605 [Sedimentisphaerales bacterium]|jgi:hypothetical protein|nr:hypothetical protein [Sedimentisphaerales bacterium]
MSRVRARGITMILVISLMGMISITFVQMARSCSQMSLQTARYYCTNIEANLLASGLAWAKVHGQTDGTVSLDTGSIAS